MPFRIGQQAMLRLDTHFVANQVDEGPNENTDNGRFDNLSACAAHCTGAEMGANNQHWLC